MTLRACRGNILLIAWLCLQGQSRVMAAPVSKWKMISLLPCAPCSREALISSLLSSGLWPMVCCACHPFSSAKDITPTSAFGLPLLVLSWGHALSKWLWMPSFSVFWSIYPHYAMNALSGAERNQTVGIFCLTKAQLPSLDTSPAPCCTVTLVSTNIVQSPSPSMLLSLSPLLPHCCLPLCKLAELACNCSLEHRMSSWPELPMAFGLGCFWWQ